MKNPICLKLVQSRGVHRSQTAVLIFSGLVPRYSNLDDEIKLLIKFGDVLEFHYPEGRMDISRFYQDVTAAIRELGYKKIFFFGVSFGGTLAYMLLRYWRRHRVDMRVRGFVALSSPFEPQNLTPFAQLELDAGVTLDRYARKAFILVIKIIRWFWRWSLGMSALYTRDNSLKQTLNALWLGGYTLNQERLVKKRVLHIPALLINVRRGINDRLVLRSNEKDFLEIFPKGRVLRVLEAHADFKGVSKTVSRHVEAVIGEGLKAGAEQFA